MGGPTLSPVAFDTSIRQMVCIHSGRALIVVISHTLRVPGTRSGLEFDREQI